MYKFDTIKKGVIVVWENFHLDGLQMLMATAEVVGVNYYDRQCPARAQYTPLSNNNESSEVASRGNATNCDSVVKRFQVVKNVCIFPLRALWTTM